MALNRAELVRRLEALERRVGTDPAVPTDVERFAHFGDAIVYHCDSCGEVNVPADVWDVCRRLLEGGYQGLFSVTFHPVEGASPEEDKAAWREAEDQAYALVQVLDALPSLIERLRQDVEEGDLLPSVEGVTPPGCEIHRQSSRVCERGTKGCLFSHTGGSYGE